MKKQTNLIHVLVGNNERPCADDDVKKVEAVVKKALEDAGISGVLLTTPNTVEIRVYSPDLQRIS